MCVWKCYGELAYLEFYLTSLDQGFSKLVLEKGSATSASPGNLSKVQLTGPHRLSKR